MKGHTLITQQKHIQSLSGDDSAASFLFQNIHKGSLEIICSPLTAAGTLDYYCSTSVHSKYYFTKIFSKPKKQNKPITKVKAQELKILNLTQKIKGIKVNNETLEKSSLNTV